jgi:hypothetical protein
VLQHDLLFFLRLSITISWHRSQNITTGKVNKSLIVNWRLHQLLVYQVHHELSTITFAKVFVSHSYILQIIFQIVVLMLELYPIFAVIAVVPVFLVYYYSTWIAWQLFINNWVVMEPEMSTMEMDLLDKFKLLRQGAEVKIRKDILNLTTKRSFFYQLELSKYFIFRPEFILESFLVSQPF